MARPREFDETLVMETIMKVFWEKGYEATSMQDLVNATGLLKGSLYGAFGDKRALYVGALGFYDQQYIQAAINRLDEAGSAQEKIARLFDSVLESMETGVFAGGCLLCNAGIEMAPVDDKVRKIVQHQISRLTNAVATAISQVDPERAVDLAGFVISVYFGTRVIAKSGMPASIVDDAKRRCVALL